MYCTTHLKGPNVPRRKSQKSRLNCLTVSPWVVFEYRTATESPKNDALVILACKIVTVLVSFLSLFARVQSIELMVKLLKENWKR